MRLSRSRTQLYLLIIQVGIIVFTLGGLTNWFRYGMSLETGVFFILYLAVVGALLIPAHVLRLVAKARKKDPHVPNTFNLNLTVVVVILSLGYLKFWTGEFIPYTGGHVTHSFHRTFTNHNGEEMEYWVEFNNPFLETHEEFLVLTKGDEEARIQIVAKSDDGPFSRGTDTDELHLEGSNYLLHTEFDAGVDRFFLVEPESMNVISNWIVHTKVMDEEENPPPSDVRQPGEG